LKCASAASLIFAILQILLFPSVLLGRKHFSNEIRRPLEFGSRFGFQNLFWRSLNRRYLDNSFSSSPKLTSFGRSYRYPGAIGCLLSSPQPIPWCDQNTPNSADVPNLQDTLGPLVKSLAICRNSCASLNPASEDLDQFIWWKFHAGKFLRRPEFQRVLKDSRARSFLFDRADQTLLFLLPDMPLFVALGAFPS
jgi:hypothetical protein